MKKTKLKSNIFNKVPLFAVHSPCKALALSLAILAFFIYGLNFFKTNFSARIWHPKDSPEIIALNNFEKSFGGDEFLLLGISYSSDIYKGDNLKDLTELTERLWYLPDVLRVSSLSNFISVEFKDDDININKIIDYNVKDDLNAESILVIKNIIKKNDQIKNVLLDKDSSYAVVLIKLKPSLGSNPNYEPFTQGLNTLLAQRYGNDLSSFSFLGPVAVANAFKEVANRDNARLMPTMFILITIVLGLYFRSVLGTLIPLLIVIFTTLEAVGFMAYMGFEFNSILGAVPGVLLGICLADAIHILTVYTQQMDSGLNKVDSLIKALEKNLVPTILTTITTGVSFLSISFTDLVPIHDLGLIAMFGTIMAWINSYLLLPSLIILLPNKLSIASRGLKKNLRLDFSQFILKHKIVISISYLFLTFIAFIFCFQNEANSDPLKYFTDNTKIRKDFEFAESKMESIRAINIVIDSKLSNGIKNPNFLKRVDIFVESIKKLPFVIKVSSLSNIVKDLNKKMNGNDVNFFRIPSDRKLIAESLFLYSIGTPPELGVDNMVDTDSRKLNLRINWLVENTIDSMRKSDEIIKIANKLGLTASKGGTFSVYAGVNAKVVASFFKSIFLTIFMVSFILLIVFKNPLLSFLAILPNLIPLIFVGAYTAISNIYIDVGASIVFTICLGIAVDDTIHFLSHYIRHKKRGMNVGDALRLTFLTSGEAILLTTLVLIIGFGSFIFAEFLPNKNFGILASSVLFLAVFTDLIFLPAILALSTGASTGKDKT